MAARVVLVRSKSPAGIEPRLAKEARSLARGGFEVHVVLWDREGAYPVEEDRNGFQIHRYPLRAPEGQPSLIPLLPRWSCHVLRQVLALRPNVVHAVDFDTAIPSLLASRILGARFVYDIFDFYAEMVTAKLPPLVRRVLASWERRVIARADLVIVPDRRREEQFAGVRPRRLVEIMNVPEDRRVVAEPAAQFVVFYGGMIAKDRGLKDVLAACESTGAKFLVAGHGPDEADLLPDLESSPACLYLGTIPYEEVLQHTAASHAIAALYDPAVPNNRYASPNKLFEAMMLAKPILVSDGTRAAEIVREIGCGVVVPYGNLEVLKDELERLMLSPSKCREMGLRGRAAFESKYNWSVMERRLLDAYSGLGFASP